MNIAVLFDGAGLARYGLEQAGHQCVGFEIDVNKHYLSQRLGSGCSVLADVRDIDLSGFDAVWASPPCQEWSQAKQNNASEKKHGDKTLLDWSIDLLDKYPDKIIWIENVISRKRDNSWGAFYNAAQFLQEPIQNRQRVIGGNYKTPFVYREFKHSYPKLGICPAITASLWHDYRRKYSEESLKIVRRREVKYYGRIPTTREAAYHQGLDVPDEWFPPPPGFTWAQWRKELYEAIGNGVPVYMAKAFGLMYD